MRYVYARLSDHDMFLFRFGGAGLGNLLLIYSKALVYAEKYQAKLIWSTWPSIKIGPWIRNEKDKRFYNDIFSNETGSIDGIQKLKFLASKKKIPEERIEEWLREDETVLVVHRYEMNFEPLIPYRKSIVDHIFQNLHPQNRKALLSDIDGVTIHVRLGDFAKADAKMAANGVNNISIPIEWYVSMLRMIRTAAKKEINAYVFSDGSDEELELLLKENNVQRMSLGTSIADIIGLSKGKMMIASGSSFSMWARYIGNIPSINFESQMRQRVTDNSMEVEKNTNSEFTQQEIDYVYRLFNG